MTLATDHVADFGDGTYRFHLPIGRLEELDDKTKAGPAALLHRLMDGSWHAGDVRETIRLGLIGGGLEAAKALILVRAYVDGVPLNPNVRLAARILVAALRGRPSEDDSLGEPGAAGPGAIRQDRLRRPETERDRDAAAATSPGTDEPAGNARRESGLEPGADRGHDGSGGGRSPGDAAVAGSVVIAMDDGRKIAMRLPNDPIVTQSLEQAVGPLMTLWARFRDGGWSPEDVRMVLMHARPGVVPLGQLTFADDVDRVLRAASGATYAPAAGAILLYLLFGVQPQA